MPNQPKFEKRQTTKDIVDEHLKAVESARGKILKNKQTARAFLVKAGIVDKSGKLTKPYR
jgi:hypothetical protein